MVIFSPITVIFSDPLIPKQSSIGYFLISQRSVASNIRKSRHQNVQFFLSLHFYTQWKFGYFSLPLNLPAVNAMQQNKIRLSS